MGGISKSSPDHKLRIVTVPCDVNDKHRELIKVTQGCRVVNYQLTIYNGKQRATLWVDVTGEEPFDGQDPVMPEGWDYRKLMDA